MNSKELRVLAASITGEIREEVKRILSERLPETQPVWQDPILVLDSHRASIWISITDRDALTNRESFDGHISWKEFERQMLDLDGQVLERYVPRFEHLLRKMKKRVSEWNDGSEEETKHGN